MLQQGILRFLFIGVLCSMFVTSGQGQSRCDFDERLPAIQQSLILQQVLDILAQSQGSLSLRSETTLPLVFHVVYRTDEENISDLQIRSQVDILNRDFAFASDNLYKVPAAFQNLGGDSDIRFCLASTDPEGHPTSGITRTKTTSTHIGTHQEPNGRFSVNYDLYGGKNGWDPDRYINIWIADMDGLLGTGTFPGMAPYPAEDGVIIDPEFVGAIGLAAGSYPFDKGHTLTHELGHYFGLFHIWGPGNGGCNVDDMIDDTPLQETPYLGCPDYPQYSCGSSDMFMNYMDFTNDRCLALFTRGQIQHMQTTLATLRSGLLDNADACAPPDSGKIDLDEALVFYAPGSHQVLITLDKFSAETREVMMFSMDGRLVYKSTWSDGSIYWIDANRLSAGIYVVQLQTDSQRITRKVFITR